MICPVVKISMSRLCGLVVFGAVSGYLVSRATQEDQPAPIGEAVEPSGLTIGQHKFLTRSKSGSLIRKFGIFEKAWRLSGTDPSRLIQTTGRDWPVLQRDPSFRDLFQAALTALWKDDPNRCLEIVASFGDPTRLQLLKQLSLVVPASGADIFVHWAEKEGLPLGVYSDTLRRWAEVQPAEAVTCLARQEPSSVRRQLIIDVTGPLMPAGDEPEVDVDTIKAMLNTPMAPDFREEFLFWLKNGTHQSELFNTLFKEYDSPSDRHELLYMHVDQLAQRDPEAALEFVRSREEDASYDDLIYNVAGLMFKTGSREEALEVVGSMVGRNMKAAFFSRQFSSTLKEQEPEQWLEFALNQEDPGNRIVAFKEAYKAWAKTDLLNALTYAVTSEDSVRAQYSLESIFNTMGISNGDPGDDELESLLGELPEPDRQPLKEAIRVVLNQ